MQTCNESRVQIGAYNLPFWWMATAIILAATSLRLVFFSGISSADDISIGNAALKLMDEGFYWPYSHYNARVMMVYPLAVIFSVFGVGELQMALLPLVASIGSLLLTGLIARHLFSNQVALWAMLAFAIFPLDVFFATQFMPDAQLGFFGAASVYCALRSLSSEGTGGKWAFAAGLIWGASYLIKIEAAFLLFPLAFIYFKDEAEWKLALATAVGCALFVVGETLVYFLHSGEFLYRLKIIVESTPAVLNDEYSGKQLWVFPRAWFVVFYQFSLHYYILFAGFIVSWRMKSKSAQLMVIWAVAYLVWLQFGFNPLSDSIGFKTHLPRYCLMLSVPMAIVIGQLLVWLKGIVPDVLRGVAVTGWILLSLFLIAFNFLSAEREQASKQVLANLSPIPGAEYYMDSGSFTIAQFLSRGSEFRDQIKLFQKHDFASGQTELITPEEIDGYVLLNRGFVDFRNKRYFARGLTRDDLLKECSLVMQVDNPSYSVSYATAQMLRGVAGFIPVAAIRDKIQTTAGSLLDGEDALLFACGDFDQAGAN